MEPNATENAGPDQSARRLILGSDQHTWGPADEPVVFAGLWCCRPSDKAIWDQRDGRMIPPYGTDLPTKIANEHRVRTLEARFLTLFTKILNALHGTGFEERHTKIFIGHWLRRSLGLLLHRIEVLRACANDPEISHVTLFEDDAAEFTPSTSFQFLDCTRDDVWNQRLFGKLIPLVFETPISVSTVQAPARNLYVRSAGGMSVKHKLVRKAADTLRMGMRSKDCFIYASYFGRVRELKLQATLGQIPQLWAPPPFSPTAQVDLAMRQRVRDQLTQALDDTLEHAVATVIVDLMPISFLEGFPELETLVRHLPWPKAPQLIFTSNSFDTDEPFKLWSISKLKTGSRYVTGQHGNNYGTLRFNHPTVEEETSDLFISWGWSRQKPLAKPGFLMKDVVHAPKQGVAQDVLLLMQYPLEAPIYAWDVYAIYQQCLNEQFQLLSQLTPAIADATIIKPHPASQSHHFDEISQLNAFASTLKIADQSESLDTLMQRSRLIVFNYDSTGILECLNQNTPMLAYWQDGLDNLVDPARADYQMLCDAGIVHLSPNTLAAHINAIWDDVETWWRSDAVQTARLRFCATYARSDDTPVATLKTLLQSAL